MIGEMLPLLLFSLIIHFGDYYFIGYDFQRRRQAMSYRFAVIVPEDMKFWRRLCLYPKNGRKEGAFIVTYDIERLTLLHQLFEIVLIVILFCMSFAEVISPLTVFYIVLFGSIVPFTGLLLVVLKLGEKVFQLSGNPVVPEAEKRKHIRNCLRRFPEERFSREVVQNQKTGLLWNQTEHILNVTDRETGETVVSQTILREESYRYLSGSITTFLEQ